MAKTEIVGVAGMEAVGIAMSATASGFSGISVVKGMNMQIIEECIKNLY